MKTKIFLFAALFMALATGAFAIVRTVSNNPNSPGQYTDLQTAINASGLTGDTLMIAGSPTSYGYAYIAKPLVLVGAGFHNPYGLNTNIDYVYFRRSNDYVNSAGSKLMGCAVYGINFEPSSGGGIFAAHNILVERCSFTYLSFGHDWSSTNQFNNDTVRNCLVNSGGYISFGGAAYSNGYGNIYIHNNLFNGAYLSGGGVNQGNCFVRNNIFINRTTYVFTNVYNWVIENNIFYGAYPSSGCSGCAYTKNIGYLCPEMPGAGNIGSGNMNNTNPQFVNFPLLGGGFSWSYDFHLMAISPGINAGTDGTDIGVYGGMLPLEIGTNPHFPQMMTLELPSGSSVPAGGTLNVHFTAKKQN
jgi:hypothetical protein